MTVANITRKPVESSQIKSIGFDPEEGILEVEFGTGSVYQYSGVSQEEHDTLVNADSIGRYFGQHIKGVYPFKKLPPEEDSKV